MESPLNVAILYPSAFDAETFDEVTATAGRPVSVQVIPYIEGFDLRIAKAQGVAKADLRQMSPEMDPRVREVLRTADAVLTADLPVDVTTLAPRLKWVHCAGAGYQHLAPEELAAHDVILTNAAGVHAPAIAEFAIARILEVFKALPARREAQKDHRWERRESRLVAGITLGIVGMGGIGSEVARLGEALGMTVTGVRRTGGSPEAFQKVVESADVLVLSVPGTPETRNMLGAGELASMKSGSIVCNVGRGSAIDEAALIDAMKNGQISAAILDVTAEEPLPESSPLWDLPNVYLSFHNASVYSGSARRMTTLFAENVCRYLHGEKLAKIVDVQRGY